MTRLAPLLALAGLILAVVLIARDNVAGIIDLLLIAGPGLVLASAFHLVSIVLNARAWQHLLPTANRTSLFTLTFATWLRESVNGLLPVARIGGELVAYRVLRRSAVPRTEAAASVVADVALSVLSQAGFALLGLGLLIMLGVTSIATAQVLIGVGLLALLGIALILAQRAGALSAIMFALDRMIAGRLRSLVDEAHRLDSAMRALYARHRDVVACLGWQLAGWIAGAGEIWLALYFLGQPRSWADAIVIEALVQAITSVAFLVPAALGVQEGGFMLIGAALGIDSTTSLALATARRLRDLIVFLPGLIAWQRAEAHGGAVRS